MYAGCVLPRRSQTDFPIRGVLPKTHIQRPFPPSTVGFTLNYDLFNEAAMDRLGLPYCNGFSGTVERRFNPSVFRYALAEQLDIASRKWSVVDGFVYLCKLHGSINWSEDDHGLFPIREHEIARSNSSLMIYPSPAKQNASLGSPYADLFREFQSRIVREQSVLFTLGYGFGDEHVNNIIYQALTVPTFRLIVFAAPIQPAKSPSSASYAIPGFGSLAGAMRRDRRLTTSKPISRGSCRNPREIGSIKQYGEC